MGARLDFHPSAAPPVKSYAKRLRQLAPGRERNRVLKAMRDALAGEPR